MQIEQFRKENYEEYIDDISGWVDSQYEKHFKKCFDSINQIHESMNSQSRTISDTELEWTLTDLPMLLFSISEDINKVRLEREVIKLRKKTVEAELTKKAEQMVSEKLMSKTCVKSYVDTELAEHDILLAAYDCLITRVESEISISRELIMGCKKIWDSRRRTENVNPVNPVVPSKEVPNYTDRYREPYIR